MAGARAKTSKSASPITVLLLNAALGGAEGNTAKLLWVARQQLLRKAKVREHALGERPDRKAVTRLLNEADAVIIGTGTYWDSWSSSLQQLLEGLTPTEGTSTWLGKPAGVIVTEHGVGGKSVLSRLQAVLSTFGALIPPMSGLVYSNANHLALQHAPAEATLDFWRPEDVAVICHNVMVAATKTGAWQTWPVDRGDGHRSWW